MRELDQAPNVGSRADGVRGHRKGDDARPLRKLPLQIVVVELEILGEARHAYRDVQVVRDLQPRRDVRVVVERRVDDLVARPQRPCERPCQ
jgi:hypothetical protein